MTGWIEFALALTLFAGSHFLPRMGRLRERLIETMGRRAYFGAYGLLSMGLLIWVVAAAIRAPDVLLWSQVPWMRWVPNLAMPLAMVLVACGFRLRQPFTLGARRGHAFVAADPGFAAVSRHPLFLALALWSGAHLVPNGELALVILFGSFLAMAVAAIPAFDAKARRQLGAEAEPFFRRTAIFSLRPLAQRDWLRGNGRIMGARALGGLLLWMALLHLHELVIGVSPFPI